MKLKAFIKSFTLYQICYLVTVFALTIGFTIFMPDEMLEDSSNTALLICSIIAVLANPICELCISKQSMINFVVDILFIEIPEFIICMAIGAYTIAIVTLVFWVPIDILSIYNWVKHRDEQKEELTVVKRLTAKQDALIILAILAFGFGVGYLVSLIPGAADSYVDALAAAFGMANGILLFLRYSEQWYAWMCTLILYIFLYISGGAYIMLISVAAMIVNTIYGYCKWYKYTKDRKELAQ